ncbi:MAG: hypothetical protein N4A57_02505 [Anaeromicrobium sp.]|jgi:hypothetical protein|uniref:hypothetical protein n=1 Tax=Anaeromicrobium sp. TaxID=1929132 RepID=UPI0025DCF4FF|nr:hypothetical protein [Anaeromicrobium sp.]MCT4593132.1 hypothetical protein [Anaeromicrobium sp.]
MKWNDVRSQYVDKWVLVEALKANSVDNKRIVKDMAVISDHTNSQDAWKEYKNLHLSDPSRELYIFHTSNEEIEVIEQRFMGVRRRNI